MLQNINNNNIQEDLSYEQDFLDDDFYEFYEYYLMDEDWYEDEFDDDDDEIGFIVRQGQPQVQPQRKQSAHNIEEMQLKALVDRCLPLPYQVQMMPEFLKAQRYKAVSENYLVKLQQLGGKSLNTLDKPIKKITFCETITLKTFKKEDEPVVML